MPIPSDRWIERLLSRSPPPLPTEHKTFPSKRENFPSTGYVIRRENEEKEKKNEKPVDREREAK